MDKKRDSDGRHQSSKRRRMIVGQAAVSEAVRDGAEPSYQTLQDMAHYHSMDPPHPVHRGNRRIRQVPSAIEPRQQSQLLEGGFATPTSADPSVGALLFGRSHQRDRNIQVSDSTLPILGHPFAFQHQLYALSNQEALRHQLQTSAAIENSLGCQGNVMYPKPFFPLSSLGDARGGLGSGSLNSRFLPGIGFETNCPLGVTDILDQQIMASSTLHSSPVPSIAMTAGDYVLGLPSSVSRVQSWSERNTSVMCDAPTGCQDLIRRLIAARYVSNDKSTIQDSGLSVAKTSSSKLSAEDLRCKGSKRISSPQEQICRDGHVSGSRDTATQELESNPLSDIRRKYVTIQVSQERASLNAPIEQSKESLKLQAPIRFFNAGVEISMNGRPLTETNNSVQSLALSKAKGKKISGRMKIETSDSGRVQELQSLQERQQSIWAAFSLDVNEAPTMKNDETKDSIQADSAYGNCSSDAVIPGNEYNSRVINFSSNNLESDLTAAGVLLTLSPQTADCITIEVKKRLGR